MKFRSNSLVIITTLMLATASLMGGCATTGMDRSVKTSNSIGEVDKEIRKLILTIDETSASLDTLTKSVQPDLKKSFKKYSNNVDNLDNEGKRVIKRLDEMKSHSKEYFSEWEKEGDTFSNADIRKLSEQRRVKLAEIYAQVPAAGVGIKGSYNEYLTELKEIQKYLSNDLTAQGIEGVTPIANKSVEHLETLRSDFRPVLRALDEIKLELYSGNK